VNKNQYDVVILGAGAAGLLAALTAGQRGRRVLVLEKANKVGKKILMSGGGRCNFTNYYVEPDNFISRNPHFCKAALSRYTQWDFIALVEQHNIAYEQRKHGQLFCENSAKDVLTMLLDECAAVGVEIKTHCNIEQVHVLGPCHYRLRTAIDKSAQPYVIECESLVVATGALSIPSLGGSGLGYELAQQFGLKLTPRCAGLVPFMFSDALKPVCERLSGVSLAVTASCGGQHFTENLLFTHRGMSGPAILQISNYWQPGDAVLLDLLPDQNAVAWLLNAKQQHSKALLKTVLSQQLPKGLVTELQALWWPEKASTPLAEFSDKHLIQIAEQLNGWRVKPSATEGYRTAEVTLGGVDTDGINPKTMEAKHQPGLYFIGEVLDVTGHLGGFNFQWAWSSGYSAGLVV